MITAIFLDLLLVLGLSVTGLLLSKLLIDKAGWLEIISLSFPLGAGFLTWLVFVLSWIGMPVALGSLLLVFTIVLILLLFIGLRNMDIGEIRIPRNWSRHLGSLRGNLRGVLVWGIILAFVGLSVIISIGRSYSLWDAVAFWAVKGYGIAHEGSIFGAERWGAHELSYPLNVSLMISFFRLVSGDVLPGSKLIFPIFYAASLLGIYSFWRHFEVGRTFAALGVLFICVVPLVFYHSTIGYTNLVLAFYLLMGFFYSLRGMLQEEPLLQSLGGILLGVAAWTRIEGIMYCLALVLALLLSRLLTKKIHVKLFHWLSPLAIISGGWLLFMGIYGFESHAVSALQDWSTEGWKYINIPAVTVVLRYLKGYILNPDLWGLYFVVIAVLLASGVRELNPTGRPEAVAALVAALGLAGSTLTLFYVASYRFGVDFVEGWLVRGFPRAFLPATLMFGVVAVLLGDLKPSARTVQDGVPSFIEPTVV